MQPIRLQQRVCTDEKRINAFLEQARTGYLGLAENGEPYVVPLNYVWLNGSIYFHGAVEGRKMEMMRSNSRACFTVSEEYGTIPHPVPAKTDTAYMSVMAFGEVAVLDDLDEATAVMQAMLDKYAPGYFDAPLAKSHVERYRSSMGSRTAVLKLTPTVLTAKVNEAPAVVS